MDDFILRSKPWQVFMALLAPYFASWYMTDEIISAGLGAIGGLLLVGWLFLIGNTLAQMGQALPGYSPAWFCANALVVAAAVVYGFAADNPDFLITATSFHAEGLWMPVMLYVLVAYLQLHWFPASLLVARKQGQRPDLSQVVGPFLLFVFWPVGVWFVQDRLNHLASKPAARPPTNSIK